MEAAASPVLNQLRRIRKPVNNQFYQAAKALVLKILQSPNGSLWKYPGLYFRPATPEVQSSLSHQESGVSTIHASHRWSRCALFLMVVKDQPIGLLFQKENHRIEIVHMPHQLSVDFFQGSILDGFLDLQGPRGQGPTFHAFDVMRYKGRWIRQGMELEQRHQLVPAARAASDKELNIQPLPLLDGLLLPHGKDSVALVIRREGRVHRGYMVCVWDPQAVGHNEDETNEEEMDGDPQLD